MDGEAAALKTTDAEVAAIKARLSAETAKLLSEASKTDAEVAAIKEKTIDDKAKLLSEAAALKAKTESEAAKTNAERRKMVFMFRATLALLGLVRPHHFSF